jgi:hypothetical protein
MTGFIGVGQLRYILTNLGEKMSDEEVDELLKAVDTSSGEINYTGEHKPLRFKQLQTLIETVIRSCSNNSCKLGIARFMTEQRMMRVWTRRIFQ